MTSRAYPFGFSVAIHAAVLAWVASGPVRGALERPQTLYEMAIAPNEKKIVWYRLNDRLPEVSPLERHGASRLPKAEVKAAQTIVSRPAGAPKANQLVWLPAPQIEIKQEFRSPNLLAFRATIEPPAPPPKPRLFAPPPEPARAPQVAPELAAPPELRGSAALNAPIVQAARPEPRAFRLPEQRRNAAALPALEAPPEAAIARGAGMQLPLPSGAGRPEPRAFRPNLAAGKTAAAAVLVVPPQVAANANPRLALPVASGAATRAQPRTFVLPGGVSGNGNGGGNGGAQAIAPPPQFASRAAAGSLPGGVAGPARPQPRPLVLPGDTGGNGRGQAGAPQLDAPQVTAGAPSGALTLAVVGLNPTERLTAPLPEGSRNARFSAGPQTRANGGDGEPVETARVFVPDLMIRNGPTAPNLALMASAAPTSEENLRQAARMVPRIPLPEASREQIAVRVTGAPAPTLEGRTVYSMTVQMPNVTSYTGSWLIWFAERGARRGDDRKVAAPVPLHKVDPKYIASAAADRVQGTVRLSAVIRRDGSVESVTLLSHLDERLDRSAEEALRKWQFEPARRDGAPIDVDAVIDIPFRLAPRKVSW